jgi:mannose-1-phosphate guanylyltransferase
MIDRDRNWVIVLAGGEGKRLSPLTRALYGVDLPKQFAVLRGERSLLQMAVARAALIAPASQTVVVVGTRYEALAREQLAHHPGVHLLVQPRNLDTGVGLMFPLAYVRAIDATARVVVMPADHDVPNPVPLVDSIARAALHRASRGRVTLVGVVPDRAEIDYGWIVPGGRLAGRSGHAVSSVTSFQEKPSDDVAQQLRARGALWNTFIVTAPIEALWQLGKTNLPRQAAVLERWARATTTEHLPTLYADLTPANWSTDVFARTPRRRLAVVAMHGSGWSDWGSPRRVFQSLAGSTDHERLVARIAAGSMGDRFELAREVA